MQQVFQRTSRERPVSRPLLLQRLLACACVGLAIWLSPPWAVGQDKAAPPLATETSPARAEPPAEALEHYNLGRELYQAGRYREALHELKEALALDPESPNLVYNVARVHELLSEIDLAIEHYVRYQKLLPADQTEELARVEGTLQRLSGARAQVAPEGPTHPPTAPQPEQAPGRQHGVADAAFWTLGVTAISAFAGAGAVGYLALKADQNVKHFTLGEDGDLGDRDKKVEQVRRMALATDVTLLAATALGLTAVLLYALRTKPVREAALPTPRAVVEMGAFSGGAMLSIRGRL